MAATNILCTDYSSAISKVLVGGFSGSTDLVAGDPSPILIQYNLDSTGSVDWHKQLNNDGSAPVVS